MYLFNCVKTIQRRSFVVAFALRFLRNMSIGSSCLASKFYRRFPEASCRIIIRTAPSFHRLKFYVFVFPYFLLRTNVIYKAAFYIVP